MAEISAGILVDGTPVIRINRKLVQQTDKGWIMDDVRLCRKMSNYLDELYKEIVTEYNPESVTRWRTK